MKIAPLFCILLACGVNDSPPSKTPAADDQAQGSVEALPYESLDELERDVVEFGRDVRGWDRVHSGYAHAVAVRSGR